VVEAGSEILGRVQRRRVCGVGPSIELGHQERTPADQVDLDLGGGEPAAHEQRAGHVHAGEVRRFHVQAQPQDDQPGEGTFGQMHELGRRLDLLRGRVERWGAAEDGLQWITGHATIFPGGRSG
jgi:hypothetical protein